ncbi:U-box domain-containing protein 25-like [Wolffia australiana]
MPDQTAAQMPLHFRCPISLELMRDPVTVATGQTYDRASIESWLAAGNRTCPVTRSPLPELSLIPNLTLRRLILRWSAADPVAVAALLLQAASPSLPDPDRVAALRRLRGAADARAAVAATPDHRADVLSLCFRAPDAVAAESLALAAAALPPLSEAESAAVAGCPERARRLGSLLASHPSAEVRASAAAMVEAAAARSAEVRAGLGRAPGLVEAVVGAVQGGGEEAGAAMGALLAVCLAKGGRERAAAMGAAEAVAERVGAGGLERGDAERGLAAVELLCRVAAGRAGVAGRGGAVEALVGAVGGKASERAAEHAAGALAAVCGEWEGARRAAVEKGAVGRLLLMVQSGCTERGKRKAQALLRLLRPAWPPCDSHAVSDDFPVPRCSAASSSSSSFNFPC